MKKGGPSTANGKAISSQNATRHGILSRSLVVPGIEQESDWEVFRRGVIESYSPESPVELELAELVASGFWRKKRIMYFESADLAIAQETIAEDVKRKSAFYPILGEAPSEAVQMKREQSHRLLLSKETMDKVIRYESHLSRELYKAMHELEAMQARRHGQQTPLARIEVSGLPDAQVRPDPGDSTVSPAADRPGGAGGAAAGNYHPLGVSTGFSVHRSEIDPAAGGSPCPRSDDDRTTAS